MKEQTKHILRLVLGWVFIVLGILGIFLPFLQGFLFLFLGLYLLSHESKWARELLVRFKKKHPKVYRKFYRLEAKYKERFRNFFKKKTR